MRRPDAAPGSVIGNVIWVILAGRWLALEHPITGIALCASVTPEGDSTPKQTLNLAVLLVGAVGPGAHSCSNERSVDSPARYHPSWGGS